MTQRGTFPPGWEENPTTWAKRIRLIVLAIVGLSVASCLTLYQMAVVTEIWDPFFPDGSPKVPQLLDPLPDSALGALSYLTAIVLSFIGGEDRCCTVLALGFVIFCGAVVSIVLLIVQPVVVGARCALCLVSAFISFAIFGWGVDEPLAAPIPARCACKRGLDLERAVGYGGPA